MSYSCFLLGFVAAPSVVLAILIRRQSRRAPAYASGIPILALIAFAYTTPWDQYLVARGIWTYPDGRVFATFGGVPAEEYVFFVAQTLLVGLLAWWLRGRIPLRRATGGGSLKARLLPACACLGVWAVSWYGLRFQPATYAALILLWALPPLCLQWVFAPRVIARNGRFLVTALAISGVYLSAADAYALNAGIWSISEATALGWKFGNVPVEEILFFTVTSLLVLQGLLLWEWARARHKGWPSKVH